MAEEGGEVPTAQQNELDQTGRKIKQQRTKYTLTVCIDSQRTLALAASTPVRSTKLEREIKDHEKRVLSPCHKRFFSQLQLAEMMRHTRVKGYEKAVWKHEFRVRKK